MKHPIKYSKYCDFSKATASHGGWFSLVQAMADDGGETPQHHLAQRFKELVKPLLGNGSLPSN